MIEEGLRWLGFGLCHQLPGHSFAAGGLQVPVCARDTGIYLGFVSSVAVLALLYRGERPSESPSRVAILLSLAFISLMAWDGLTSNVGWRETTNSLRLITGILAGYAIGLFLLPILNGQLWSRPGRGRVLGGAGELAWWLVSIPVAFGIAGWVMPLTGRFFALAVAGAIVFTFACVNLALVSLLPWFERRARRLRDVWPGATLALLFSIAELAASAWLKTLLTGVAGSVQ